MIVGVAPALGAIGPLKKVQFNGTLDYPSPFRGKGPSVDAAWETIVRRDTSKSTLHSAVVADQCSLVGAFGISDSDFQNLNQPDIPELVRLSERQGGQISGALEIFHQLHCIVRLARVLHLDLLAESGLRISSDSIRTETTMRLQMPFQTRQR